MPAPYRTHIDTLARLVENARRDGFDWALPYPCLLVGAVDYAVWGGQADEYNARSAERRLAVGWGADEPDTLAWTASMKRIRDRGWSVSSVAPYTIFPLPAEDVADLVMGFIDMCVSLHLPGLEAALERDGLQVRVVRPPFAEGTFLQATRGSAGVVVPARIREQLMDELMTVDCLFAALDEAVRLNEADATAGHGQRIVTFADESDVWEREPAQFPAPARLR